MTKVTIVGRERFALDALKRLQAAGLTINKVITDDQGILFQHAQLVGIPCQLKNLGSKVLASEIPDGTAVILSLHNYMYITPEAIARAGKAIGYHPSLLPAYPGRRAIQEAIADGQSVTGGTLFHLDAGYDTGEIISQRACPIHAGDTPRVLWERLAAIGLELLGDIKEDLKDI